MRGGKLRHLMTLQQPVTTQSATTGEMVTVWTEVAKVWASLEPLSANAFVAAGAEQSEVTARVTIRFRDDVTSKMRLAYRGMYYDIKGVLADPKSGLEYLTLPVGEGVRYENPTPPAPISCAITLLSPSWTSLFEGLAFASVSGQTVVLDTDVTEETLFGAAEKAGLEDNYLINWSGRRYIGVTQTGVSGGRSNANFQWGKAGTGKIVGFVFTDVGWQGDGWSLIDTQDAVTNPYLVIDGDTGNVEWWDGDTLRDTVEGFFDTALDTGQVFLVAYPEEPAQATFTVITTGADYALGGANDWCGNPI